MCRCLSRHWSLTFCTLNSFKLYTHQWMCTSSYTQAFPFFLLLSWVEKDDKRYRKQGKGKFSQGKGGTKTCDDSSIGSCVRASVTEARVTVYVCVHMPRECVRGWVRGCVCTDLRVYSDVGVVGVQLTQYSLEVMREYGRHEEPCNWSQDSVKHACTARQRLSLASALLLPDRTRETVLLEFPSSRNRFPSTVLVMPKYCFSKIPLSRWTTHLPVTCWYTSALFEGATNKFREISP